MPSLAMRIHHLHHHSAWNVAGDIVLIIAVIATICAVVGLLLVLFKRPSPFNWIVASVVAVIAWVLLLLLF